MPCWQEVANGTAVADYQSLEAPLIAQNVLQQTVRATTGIALKALVGTHHLLHVALLHQCLKGGQIGLPQVSLRQVLNVKVVARLLRSAMHSIVLGTGMKLEVLVLAGFASQICTLQATNHPQSHLGVHEWVFTIGLLTTSPARVAEDVDVGCPERQTTIALEFILASGHCVLGTRLVAHCRIDAFQQCVVERAGHTDALWEDGGYPVAPYAVQCLAPPFEGGYAQSGYGWRAIHHQTGFLFQRQSSQQVVHTLFNTQCWILVGQLCPRRQRSCYQKHCQKEIFLCYHNSHLITTLRPFTMYSPLDN